MVDTDAAAASWAGLRLQQVVAAWFESDHGRDPDPVHVWVELDGVGWRQFHCAGSGALIVRDEVPYASHRMDELRGRVVVEPGGPRPLADVVGCRVESVTHLEQRPPGMAVGVVLGTDGGAVAVANLGDQLGVVAWPDDAWLAAGVRPG